LVVSHFSTVLYLEGDAFGLFAVLLCAYLWIPFLLRCESSTPYAFFHTRSTCIKYLPSGTDDINRILTSNSRILTPKSCCLAYLFITKMMVVFNSSLLQIYITLHIHNIYWGISHKLFLGPIVYLFS